jgi:hypothetical protein
MNAMHVNYFMAHAALMNMGDSSRSQTELYAIGAFKVEEQFAFGV